MISNDILSVLAQARRPLSVSEIRERTKADAGQVRETLHELAEQGKVFGVKGNRYADPSVLRLMLCRARSQVNAPTFARPLDGSSDFYLDMPDETAFDGDRQCLFVLCLPNVHIEFSFQNAFSMIISTVSFRMKILISSASFAVIDFSSSSHFSASVSFCSETVCRYAFSDQP